MVQVERKNKQQTKTYYNIVLSWSFCHGGHDEVLRILEYNMLVELQLCSAAGTEASKHRE
uniref:Uncharacterized protein n=1 Tax=Megaselia scalaris TaxID=36166 RepID=T1GKI9_MEGSC